MSCIRTLFIFILFCVIVGKDRHPSARWLCRTAVCKTPHVRVLLRLYGQVCHTRVTLTLTRRFFLLHAISSARILSYCYYLSLTRFCTCLIRDFRFVDRKDFEYIEMDTDSAYMALSDSLPLVIRPELRKDFWLEYGNWFPRPFCERHQKDFVAAKMAEYDGGEPWSGGECCTSVLRHDMRTPGLFKVEFEGVGMVALNSKTYCCWNDDTCKYSSKGVSKSTTRFTKDDFAGVLKDNKPVHGTNKGFVLRQNKMFSYAQSRAGLTSLYAKRRVLDDGVSTTHLDI